MAIPGSGPISMSMLNVEVGKASNAANTALAGASTPSVGSLFWLGAQSGSLNQTAPHQISEWYGYTANQVTLPLPYIKIDAFSSSYAGSTVSNVGAAGSTYDLTAFGSPTIGGTGGGSYFILNETLTSQFLTSSVALNLSASSFTVSSMVYIPKLATTTLDTYINITTASVSPNSGYQLKPRDSGGNLFPTTASSFVWGTSVSAVFANNPISLNTWYNFVLTFSYQNATGSGTFYFNNVSGSTLQARNNELPTGNNYRIGIGARTTDSFFYSGSMRFANFSYWTSSLSAAQVNLIFQEFDARY